MRDLHTLGFINRDLTSRNVVRDKLGRLRIIDLEHVRHHTCHADNSRFDQHRESVLNCEDFSCTVIRLGVHDFYT
jgi:serine/threonine protein kinase